MDNTIYRITEGVHKGRIGKIVGKRWFGYRVCLNVQANEEEVRKRYGENYGDRITEVIGDPNAREWLWVWKRQTEVAATMKGYTLYE